MITLKQRLPLIFGIAIALFCAAFLGSTIQAAYGWLWGVVARAGLLFEVVIVTYLVLRNKNSK
jgi:CHASE2 domain-containing sensor protein